MSDQKLALVFPTSSEVPERAPEYPIMVAEWRRNSREIIRVQLDIYNGIETVDARAWWTDPEGNLRPSRSGLTLSLKHLPALSEGLADALHRARALGLVEPERTAAKTRAAERQRRYRERHHRTRNVTRNA